MGKIIAIYDGVYKRTGSTTLAISLATGLSFWGNKKVLILNHSDDTKMEQYMKDINFQYTLDYLNVFKGEEMHIINSIHHKLDGIGNFEIVENFTDSKMPLKIYGFLANIKDYYDFIVIDTTYKHIQYYSEMVDIFLPLVEFDSYCIDEYKRNLLVAPCDRSAKSQICVINKMPLGLCGEDHVQKILQAQNIGKFMSVVLDSNVAYYTHFDDLYQYLVDNINQDDTFINNILDISFEVMKLADNSLIFMEPSKKKISKKFVELFHLKKGVVRT